LEYLFVPNKKKWNFLNGNLLQRRHGFLEEGEGEGEGGIAKYVAASGFAV